MDDATRLQKLITARDNLKLTTAGYQASYMNNPNTRWYKAMAPLNEVIVDLQGTPTPVPPVPTPAPDPAPVPIPPSGAMNLVGVPVKRENIPVTLNSWSNNTPKVVQPGGLQAALKGTVSGDCLSLAPGNFDEAIAFDVSNVTIRFQKGAVARNRWRITGDGNTIFDYVGRWVSGVSMADDVLLYPNGANALQLIGGDMQGTRWSGMFFGSDMCNDCRVIGYKFYDCGGPRENLDHDVYAGHCRGFYVGYCLMQGRDRTHGDTQVGTAWGVQFYPDSSNGQADHITVVWVDKGGVIVDFSSGVSTNNKITNSIFAHTANGLNKLTNQGYAARVTNPGSASASADRCLHYDTPQSAPWDGIKTSNILKADPKFVRDTSDPSISDFHLQSGSLAIGAGSDGLNLGCYV